MRLPSTSHYPYQTAKDKKKIKIPRRCLNATERVPIHIKFSCPALRKKQTHFLHGHVL